MGVLAESLRKWANSLCMVGVRGARQRAGCAVRVGPLGRLEGFRFRLLAS